MDRCTRTHHRPPRSLSLAHFASLLAIIALLTSACGSLKNPTPTPAPTPSAAATPQLAASPTLPTGNDMKIDSVLLDVGEAYKQAIVDKVKALGGRVPSIFENQIDVVVPLDTVLKYAGANHQNLMQELAAFANVKEVQVTPRPVAEGLEMPAGTTFAEFQAAVRALAVEGVAMTGADKWHEAGFTGKGVKIGIIDGGFKGYKSLLGKELPQNLTMKAFTEDGEHGTGVADPGPAVVRHADPLLRHSGSGRHGGVPRHRLRAGRLLRPADHQRSGRRDALRQRGGRRQPRVQRHDHRR